MRSQCIGLIYKVLVPWCQFLNPKKKVNVEHTIECYIPELSGSDGGVKIKNILDMATGLKCPEEYVDKSACYYVYSSAP